MKLYGYWRSSSSYRVRIALNLKGLPFKSETVNLVMQEQESAAYAALNPARGVPTLELDDGTLLTQSMAILDWLDEAYPLPPLLPADPIGRAHVRAAALVIAAEVHPVNNLRVVNRLKAMGHGPDETADWMRHWMARGLDACSSLIAPDTTYCFGNQPGLADLCLIPQLYNARRWALDLNPYSRLTAIETACLALPAFDAARPEVQPDAP